MDSRKLKQIRVKHLLEVMKHTPMTVWQMAEEINASPRMASEYLTEFKFKKLVFIAKYERTSGSPAVYYQVGNQPDAPRLERIDYSIHNKRYREKHKLNKQNRPFVPRMDIAAAWLRNPI